ncbi:vesicle-associated protein 1-1-like [Macadamia integrifolia]|uniref:vesicle-associated protein 1-1-like n=1 Tax=Macadamia integrifolia TaxID=60698 RepID=UPI001C52F616|nr:vesicle-associated protein 1-1-like [Macadamia integrifolia]XP_042520793.1 vesicle-associated protein 1-1-like [Macadamia integrifolia]XP_042520794.1 vesicle-associated protein 1-1-like [Macadamia integrifolia]
MNTELLGIQPHELKFTFELKKRSSCSIQLVNNSSQYVAFKVKTTSPKNYCVQPNIGIVRPSSTCNFTVTMQAQREAPPDMQCKDKFLIQSTIVPFGTTEEDITPSTFMKDGFKYIEENKLKVVLVSPAHSPVLQPINGTLKLDSAHEASISTDQILNGVENHPPSHMVATAAVEEFKPSKDVDSKPAKSVEELKPSKDVDSKPAKSAEELKPSKDVDSKPAKSVEELKLLKEIELKLAKENKEQKLAKATEELNSKLNEWKLKLSEANTSIAKLTAEKTIIIQEREALRQELAVLRKKNGVRSVKVGFPFLFVCMIGLIGVALGYILHS